MSSTEYLTREIAAQRLGISERRLLDLAQRGLIARKYVRDDRSGQKMSVFSVKDIERYLTQHGPASPPESRSRVALLPTRSMQTAGLHTQSMPNNPGPAGPHLPRWLTLQQGSLYIGLPVGYLRRLIREGKLPAIDLGHAVGGRWRVSRKDLAAIQGYVQRSDT